MTKAKHIIISAIATVGFILVAAFSMLCIEMNFHPKKIKKPSNDYNVSASGYILNTNMSDADYIQNTFFYIDNADGVDALIEATVSKGMDFFNKVVILSVDVDMYGGFVSFGKFRGVFDGQNHVIHNFETNGLFSHLDHETGSDYLHSHTSYIYKDYKDEQNYFCLIQNLYISNVCLNFVDDPSGEFSPFIGTISADDVGISIKNCGVKGIKIPLNYELNPERWRFTISGLFSKYIGYGYGTNFKFEDCYIDSRVFYFNWGEGYTTTDPIDYIIGPMENTVAVAFPISIINSYCINTTDQNIPWSVNKYATITDSYQHEKDIPRDHDIFKATSKGGTWEDVKEKWYQYEWFNDGYPIPRPLTTWHEITFTPIEEKGNRIKEIKPASIFVPDFQKDGINDYDERYVCFCVGPLDDEEPALRNYEGTNPTLNLLGHNITTVPEAGYIINAICYTLEGVDDYIVSISTEKAYMMLKIYHTDDKVNTLITLHTGYTVVYNQPNGSTPIKEYIIKSGDHFTITELKKFRNEEVCITKNYGTSSTQEIYVNLIKTVTFTVPYYQEKTYKLLGELKITFTVKEEYSNSYSLCNIFEDENVDMTGYRKVSLVDTRLVSGNMSIGMLSEIKKYSVIISGNEW